MELRKVRPEDRELFWNINQKYLYEMTNYYDDELDELGNLHYGFFDAYFTDPKRKAFFIYEQEALAGFAMVNPYSNLDEDPDFVMAEFTIIPMYRRRHLATEAAETLFQMFQGSWEVKYNEKNPAAKELWNKVTEKYHPRKVRLHEEETVLTFCTQ